MNKEKVKNKVVNGCLIAIIGWSLFFAIMIAIGTRPKTYTSFGDEEIEIIRKHMGITIEGSTTPVKLKETHGGGDYDYQLWLEDIDDAEKFMENCFDGTYSVVEDLHSLETFGGTKGSNAYYDYEDRIVSGAYIAYNCELPEGYNWFDDYHIVFYKDEDSFKAKLYACKT
ncbi:hypothetical protein [Ruminococcus albus]|uniref:hypothetical protein n=1 Tax=Ruminococcus albus TaxID=1264 RepID=UPI0004662D5E|nr:hypothetical protein [Ruminococcus albus]